MAFQNLEQKTELFLESRAWTLDCVFPFANARNPVATFRVSPFVLNDLEPAEPEIKRSKSDVIYERMEAFSFEAVLSIPTLLAHRARGKIALIGLETLLVMSPEIAVPPTERKWGRSG